MFLKGHEANQELGLRRSTHWLRLAVAAAAVAVAVALSERNASLTGSSKRRTIARKLIYFVFVRGVKPAVQSFVSRRNSEGSRPSTAGG